MKKLENLISFDDFKSNWKEEKSKETKRTKTGLDVLKENVEEIIPEGPPEEWDGSIGSENPEDTTRFYPDYNYKSYNDKVKEIIYFLDDNKLDGGTEDEIINQLREALLEMEQMGFVDEELTDDLDDEYDGDWNGWIKAVVQLPDFPEEVLDNVLEVIKNVSPDEFETDEFEE